MSYADFQQRVEELQLALANLFESPKAPAVSAVDEGETLYLQVSWVTESRRDTTLDARCVVTLRLSRAQLERYGALDTRRRRVAQERLAGFVRDQFAAQPTPATGQDECSLELTVADTLLDVPEAPY